MMSEGGSAGASAPPHKAHHGKHRSGHKKAGSHRLSSEKEKEKKQEEVQQQQQEQQKPKKDDSEEESTSDSSSVEKQQQQQQHKNKKHKGKPIYPEDETSTTSTTTTTPAATTPPKTTDQTVSKDGPQETQLKLQQQPPPSLEESEKEKTTTNPTTTATMPSSDASSSVNQSQESEECKLPAGWEVRIEPKSGRKYYVDHNTRSTHWSPPEKPSVEPTTTTNPPLPTEKQPQPQPQQPQPMNAVQQLQQIQQQLLQEALPWPEPRITAEEILAHGPPEGHRSCLRTQILTTSSPSLAPSPGPLTESPSLTDFVAAMGTNVDDSEDGLNVVGEFTMDVLLALRTAVNMSYALFIPENNNDQQQQQQKSTSTTTTTTTQQTVNITDSPALKTTPNTDGNSLTVEEKEMRTFYVTHSHRISRPGSRGNMVVKDYAPDAFDIIRRMCGIDRQHYLEVWATPKMPQRSSGKSGSSMIYSDDQKMILKTISHTEAKTLFGLLPNYMRYITENPKSLLVKFFGLHRLTRGHEEIYFTVFTNVFDPSVSVQEVYDLKGSTIGRQVLIPNRPVLRRQASVLKDLDFNRSLFLDTDQRSELVSQIEKDTNFLCKNNIMDYSLLVGVHRNVLNAEQQQQQQQGGAQNASNGLDDELIQQAIAAGILQPVAEKPKHKLTDEAAPIRPPSPTTSTTTPIQPIQSQSSQSSTSQQQQQQQIPNNVTAPKPNVPLVHIQGMDSPIGGMSTPSPTSAKRKKKSFVCFVEETYNPQLQNVPKHLLKTPTSPSPQTTRASSLPSTTTTNKGNNTNEENSTTDTNETSLKPPTSPNAQTKTNATHQIPVTPLAANSTTTTSVVTNPEDDLYRIDSHAWSGIQARGHDEVYYFGVIDILTRYGAQKKIAGFFKTLKHDRESVSTVDPEFYSRRFLQMIEQKITTVSQ